MIHPEEDKILEECDEIMWEYNELFDMYEEDNAFLDHEDFMWHLEREDGMHG